MKILILGDLHGRKPRIHFKDFDAIIQVGDVCDDRFMAKHYRGWFKYLKDYDKIDFSDYLRMKGFSKKDEKEAERKSLESGRRVMEYLDSIGKPVFFVPGNWDQSYGKTDVDEKDENPYRRIKYIYDIYLARKTNSRLTQGLKNIKDCQYQLHTLGEINILGYGLSSIPENPKQRWKNKKSTARQRNKLLKQYGKIHRSLKLEYQKRNKSLATIFLSHNVPYNTKLDKIMDKDSIQYKEHFGSTVAREFCERYQPLLCVGGHMHEHYGKDKIGKTVVINAGFGRDANVLLVIEKGELKKITFNEDYKH